MRLRLAFLLLLPAYALGVRLYLFDDWIAPSARFAAQLGTGFLIAAAHWVFFSLVPRRRAAVYYCASLAAGFALEECQRTILFAQPPPGTVGNPELLHLRLVIYATGLFALALAPGIAAALRREPPSDDEAGAAGNGKTTASLLLLIALFFLLHGLVNSTFMPFYIASRALDNTGLLAVLVSAAFGAGGWLFTRGFARGFRLVVIVCGVVHLAVPAFSFFKANAPVVVTVHALAGPLNYLVTAAATIALAMVAPRRWQVLTITAPLAIKAIFALYIPHLLRGISRESEIIPLAAILTAIAFYVYGQKIDFAVFATDAAPPEAPRDPSPPIAEAEDEAVPDSGAIIRRVIGELRATYGFSGRESEVAELLVSGMSPEAIGERLGLAANTVNTYVRRVILKCGSGGRKDFIGMVMRACEAATTPAPEQDAESPNAEI